jgi:flagellar hook-length control protein FliK
VRLPAQAGERNTHEPAALAAPELGAWQQAQAAVVLTDTGGRLREPPDQRQAELAAPSDGALATLGFAGLTLPAHTTGKAGEAVTVNLATPATSAEFRAALGAQVSWFARAGVQQAELHLNPADMGPVSIQIVLDGQQAQVNFGADSALTRQIIESGMPELAGALRDAGLTLTGGGVSQHSGGQRQDANGHGAPGGSASNVQPSGTVVDETMQAQAVQARRSVVRSAMGGIDLYA